MISGPPPIEPRGLYLGGQWTEPSLGGYVPVVSPYTEQAIATAPMASVEDIDRAVRLAADAFEHGEWRRAAVSERIAVLRRFLVLLEENRDRMADVLTAEMGSPIAFSRGPGTGDAIASLAATLDAAESFAWEMPLAGAHGAVLVRREPVGVVAAITPWNVPQLIIMNKIAPALLAGCSVVLKPAPETPLDALLLAELLERAGLPRGVLSVVPAGREDSDALIRHPLVDKVSFTGSTAVGRHIASVCGDSLTRVSLELGGKSAAIVLDDADLERVSSTLRGAAYGLSGQICLAQTRVLASRGRYAEVVDSLSAMVESLVIGDPADHRTEIGPLVSPRQRDRVDSYIRIGIAEGARVVAGGPGAPVAQPTGWFARPTLFADVTPGMRIAREEIFGPVVVVIPYEDEDEAVTIANDSPFGLSGTVWTPDAERGLSIARRVRTGNFGVNRFALDPKAPFGGFKASGIGREFAADGIASYVELQTINL